MCNHLLVKCPHCGEEISPASLLGQAKKTMTDAATLQRKQAAQSRWKKKKKNDG